MRDPRQMARSSTQGIPATLRPGLEQARLDLLALFRALDRMALEPPEIPQRLLRQLFELDAGFAEALWALDQPPGRLDLQAMLRDTLAALKRLPDALARFRSKTPKPAAATLAQIQVSIRQGLSPAEAYNMIPGRDPPIG